MITRDISLEDCILDLIDNSIDGAWRLEGGQPMSLDHGADLSKYMIEMNANAQGFSIRDNCGGITLDNAAEYAFTFGRKEKEAEDPYSIGVYGIGMKRAVFKIGAKINIRSTYRTPDSVESFQVPIDVPAWMVNETDGWDFDIAVADDLPAPGVEITVTNLTASTENSLGSPAFIQMLRRTIGRDYAIFLHRGLTIKLNGSKVSPWQIELRSGAEFAPMRIAYDETINGEIVKVEILAGMAAAPPEEVVPDDEKDGEKPYGWYVVCNGRIVLAANKTETTGWGADGWPHWHSQYYGFLGLVMFTSAQTKLLPLTTTKRSVDVSSEVFRRAGPKMRDAVRLWIDYTNARKGSLEQAKKLEAQATPVSIFKIATSSAISVPRFAPQPKVKVANISYSVPLERQRALASALGNVNMSYRDVGINSFEYTYKDHVGDE